MPVSCAYQTGIVCGTSSPYDTTILSACPAACACPLGAGWAAALGAAETGPLGLAEAGAAAALLAAALGFAAATLGLDATLADGVAPPPQAARDSAITPSNA